jgi:Domain of unknown function (DUF6249)
MSTNTFALLIPIIAVTGSLSALIVWIVVSYRRGVHEVDCRHKERMAAIEKGGELPPEPPQAEQAAHSRYLLRGLIWLGVGLAITFGGHEWLDHPFEGAGWIPVAVGAAYLIFYFVEVLRAWLAKRDESASGGERTV